MKKLYSGNEAFALGAWAAGLRFAAGYPGTPSTEVLEALASMPDLECEWSVNEKVALEAAIGASLGGARSLATMKHVGLNVAADPLFTASYIGVTGGLVILVADDPAMHSSQNEQDSRHYAVAAKLPMLEPADPSEAYHFMLQACALSERFDTPVLMRSATRLSHGQGVIHDTAQTRETPLSKSFAKNPAKYVMIPAYARRAHLRVEQRLLDICAADFPEFNREELGRDRSNRDVGYITSGSAYTYLREIAPDASVLKLGLVHPLPASLIRAFARQVNRVVVVEELDPVLENAVRALGIACEGKSLLPLCGEFEPALLARSLGIVLGAEKQPAEGDAPSANISGAAGGAAHNAADMPALPPRFPALCPGCPHIQVFRVLGDLGAVVSGDIGCYALGALPPYNAMDTCVDMGAAITLAQGLEVSGGTTAMIAAVIGDSTFMHSGLTGLVNAAYNRRHTLVLVLDNGTTAMTGMQPNPTTGYTISGAESFRFRYDLFAASVGIAPENYAEVNAYKPDEIRDTLLRMHASKKLSLIIVRGTCVILKRKQAKSARAGGTP